MTVTLTITISPLLELCYFRYQTTCISCHKKKKSQSQEVTALNYLRELELHPLSLRTASAFQYWQLIVQYLSIGNLLTLPMRRQT